MGNLIFLIIIVIVIRIVLEKKKGRQEKDRRDDTWNAGSAGTRLKKELSQGAKNMAQLYGHDTEEAQRAPAAAGNPYSAPRRTAAASQKAGALAKAGQSDAGTGDAQKAEQISTTEYLRQKAMEDQRDHEQEARMEAIRLQRETGGRRAAQRYYDGDSIPRGMRIVKCGYCGAENLIGDHQNQKDFTCYFCREIL